MALLKFAARSNYNGALYLPGKVYDVVDEPPGYVNRWLRRGVAEVVEAADEVLSDPRGGDVPSDEPEPVEEDFDFSDPDEDEVPEEDEEDEEEDDED